VAPGEALGSLCLRGGKGKLSSLDYLCVGPGKGNRFMMIIACKTGVGKVNLVGYCV
jgi:hypothetical protein